MSSCIEFCGTNKRKNKRPEGKLREMKTEVPIKSNERDQELRKKEILNRLRYVEVKVKDEQYMPPPRGIDINIDM